MEEVTKALTLFYCYAREDKLLREELDVHLSGLKRQYNIKSWSDREIQAGKDWEKEIDTHLDSADLVFLLVSPNFMASDYCYGIETRRALDKHDRGESRVIPIILRPVDWQDAPFNRLQVLPTNALPITRWEDRDDAFEDVVKGIRLVVKELLMILETKKIQDGPNGVELEQQPEQISKTFDRVTQLEPNDSTSYREKGEVLESLNYDEDALIAFNETIRLNPRDSVASRMKGELLAELNRPKEAIEALNYATRIDSRDAEAELLKGEVFITLGKPVDAQLALDRASMIGVLTMEMSRRLGKAYNSIGRYDAARDIFQDIIQLDPDHYAEDYSTLGFISIKLS